MLLDTLKRIALNPPRMFGLSPNSTGTAVWVVGTNGDTNSYGALSIKPAGSQCSMMQNGQGDLTLKLDLSKGNAIFSGSKVQAPALQILACIKV